LKAAAKETQRALRQALKGNELRQLASEEKRLRAQRAKAMKDEQWQQVAIIDGRLAEIDAIQEQSQAARAHYRKEKRDLEMIQKELKVGAKEAQRLYEKANRDAKLAIEIGVKGQGALDAATEDAEALADLDGTININYHGNLSGRMMRAAGGPVEAGRAYVVGEREPELFVPDRPGVIIPSTRPQLAAAVEPTVGGDTYHTQVYGLPMQATTPAQVVAEIRRSVRMGIIRPAGSRKGFAPT